MKKAAPKGGFPKDEVAAGNLVSSWSEAVASEAG
jgi:hypothetical protein